MNAVPIRVTIAPFDMLRYDSNVTEEMLKYCDKTLDMQKIDLGIYFLKGNPYAWSSLMFSNVYYPCIAVATTYTSTRMSFGRYKDKRLHDVPMCYLEWIVRIYDDNSIWPESKLMGAAVKNYLLELKYGEILERRKACQ